MDEVKNRINICLEKMNDDDLIFLRRILISLEEYKKEKKAEKKL